MIDKARAVFDQFDTDHGGSIDFIELTTALHNMGQTIDPEELRKMIREIDDDGNEEIEFDEFLQLLQMIKNKGSFISALNDIVEELPTDFDATALRNYKSQMVAVNRRQLTLPRNFSKNIASV